MNCECGAKTIVKDSRPSPTTNGTTTWRRRECIVCKLRFTTIETFCITVPSKGRPVGAKARKDPQAPKPSRKQLAPPVVAPIAPGFTIRPVRIRTVSARERIQRIRDDIEALK